MSLIGLVFICYAAFMNAEDTKNYGNNEKYFGLSCFIVSLIMEGIYFISEEKLFKKFYIPPFEMIGLEGLISLLFIILLIIPLNFIHCNMFINN